MIENKIEYKTNSRYNGFLITKVVQVEEISCQLVELLHEESGCHIMHIQNDDPENLFCISFRTLPQSSNGVAHILEHTVLCGSKKYPVKDPFFSMNRRSVNTFMNALTGQDFTCYPAATQNEQDFYNLLEVYIDSVFHPLLTPLSFAQEGHRLEFATPNDPTSELQYKGVVFNEMKGALSSPSSRLFEAITKYLYPGSPYGFNSGGDPTEIPSLSHEELLHFHKTYYHPSRSLFFFYGNMPLEKHLDFIAVKALHGVKKEAPLPPIPYTQRMLAPFRKELMYPVAQDADDAGQTLLGFGFLTTSVLDEMTILGLSVLDIILMETDASLLRLPLIESGLCTQASSYLGTETLEIPFILILKGVQDNAEQKLEDLIQKTLIHIAEHEIPEKLIESALHQLELAKLEIGSNGSGPFGLSLFARTALLKQHGGKAEDGLHIYSLFQELRNTIYTKPRYLQELIIKYFINNRHFVRITMKPSTTLMQQEADREKDILEQIQKRMTEKEKQLLVEQSMALLRLQEEESHQNLEVLPKISIRDIPRTSRNFELTQHKENATTLFHHGCFTNHLTYADLIFPMPEIKQEDFWTVRLFSQLATQIGVGTRNYQQNLEYVQEHTGGVAAGFALYHQVDHRDHFTPSFYFKGKSLYRKSDKLFSLMAEMATQLDFTDRRRIKDLINRLWTNVSNSINQNALRYAINLSASPLSRSNAFMQQTYGLDYFMKIRSLMQHYDAQEDELISKLNSMKELLLCNQGAHIVLTCDATEYSTHLENGLYGLLDIPAKPHTPWKGNISIPHVHAQGRIIASPVAFTAQSFTSVPYNHPAAPALGIAANLFENKVLHKRIREQGGAYGAGASYSTMTGTFYFYSYSDPNIASTLQAFEESIHMIGDKKFSDSELEEAKLGILQSLDAPVPPSSRADVAYGWWREGKDKMMRLHYRNRTLEITKEEIVEAVRQHILEPFAKGVVVSFAKKELLERENKKLKATPLKLMPVVEE